MNLLSATQQEQRVNKQQTKTKTEEEVEMDDLPALEISIKDTAARQSSLLGRNNIMAISLWSVNTLLNQRLIS